MSYLLSDKTGTLTCNTMVFKKLHLGSAAYTDDTFDEVQSALQAEYSESQQRRDKNVGGRRPGQSEWLVAAVEALALCHNVTPVYETQEEETEGPESEQGNTGVTYQASSPDEIALVRFADSMGMKLIERDQNLIKIANTTGTEENYEVLANFPFSSDTKRMGIVLRQVETGQIIFYLKGAEVVMKATVRPG